MKTKMMILTGALFTLSAFAQGDPMAEERYKMKYGRYTPAEEARQKALKEGRKTAEEQPVVAACCRKTNSALKISASEAFAEERSRVKYGRSTPAGEGGAAKGAELVAAHVSKCVELGKCTLMRTAVTESRPAAKESWRESWFRAKFGRSTMTKAEEPNVFAAANHAGCEHECCKNAD